VIETRVAGIPCLIDVEHVFVQPPLGPMCDSDWDANGYTDLEYTVCDRRGRPAPWLARKLTPDDTCRIEDEVLAHLAERDDY